MTSISRPQIKEKVIGVLLVIFAICFNFWFMGWPTLVLNAGLLIALLIWANFNTYYSQKLLWLYVMGVLLQMAHFSEEFFTGFYKVFPLLFNGNPWTSNQFLIFNIIWMLIFLTSLIGTFKGFNLSFLCLWFFIIIGCIGNGVFHIGLTLLRQKYFSGTVTAILLLAIGIITIKEIRNSAHKIDGHYGG
jgi:hypothetical protein